jgi:hypothetical protein
MSSDEADDAAFRELLLADPRLAPVLSDAARFRAQVLLTEVVETSGAGTEACPHSRHTRLRRHAFRADAEYFYPASTVKLFGAIAACVALRELARAHPGLDKDTPLAFGAAPRGDDVPIETEDEATAKNTHSTSSRDVTTLRAELAKLFLVSDNRAFNRCFDLCGPSGIRRWTARHVPGEDVRVTHRLFDDAGEAKQSEARGAELPEVWARLPNDANAATRAGFGCWREDETSVVSRRKDRLLLSRKESLRPNDETRVTTAWALPFAAQERAT